MSEQDETRGRPERADRVKQATHDRLRKLDKLRLEYVEAAYTKIGQRALAMWITGTLWAALNGILLVILIFT